MAKAKQTETKSPSNPGIPRLLSQVYDHIRAGFSGIWILTQDSAAALQLLQKLAEHKEWLLASWDAARGVETLYSPDGTTKSAKPAPFGGALATKGSTPLGTGQTSPHMGLNEMFEMAAVLKEPQRLLGVFHNPQRFFDKASTIQAMHIALEQARSRTTPVTLIVMSSWLDLPQELDKDFVIIDDPLPDQDTLADVLDDIGFGDPSDSNPEKPEISPETRKELLTAASGMTRVEAANVFSLSLARYNEFRPAAIMDMKAQELKKSAALELYRGDRKFSDLGGLEGLKLFCRDLLTSDAWKSYSDVRPNGVLLLGLPGTGKSEFCKALGNEIGRPTIRFSPADVYGKYVGDSEGEMRRTLKIVDSMAPCVLFID